MRIIAGKAKGHTIKAPKGIDTRPTLDRVRESMFNVLSNYGIVEKTILDIFSGTGAVALEALSRGASHAVVIDKATAKLIKANALHCHLEDDIEILAATISQAVKRLEGRQFDYIFSDPPYQKNFISATIAMVEKGNLLAPQGILILERHEKEDVVLPEGWSIIKEQEFGYTMITYCAKE